MTSGLGNIVTLTSEVSNLTAAYVLGRLGQTLETCVWARDELEAQGLWKQGRIRKDSG